VLSGVLISNMAMKFEFEKYLPYKHYSDGQNIIVNHYNVLPQISLPYLKSAHPKAYEATLNTRVFLKIWSSVIWQFQMFKHCFLLFLFMDVCS